MKNVTPKKLTVAQKKIVASLKDAGYKFTYAGAGTTRFRDFRINTGSRSEAQMLPYYDRLRIITRLRQMVRDDAVCAAILSAYPVQLGTSTLNSLEHTAADPDTGEDAATPDAAAALFNDAHETEWCGWSCNCEYTGMSLSQVETIAWREDLIAGEVFLLKLKSGKVQLIPSEFCFSEDVSIFSKSATAQPGRDEKDGIVVQDGVVTGYRFGFRDSGGNLQQGKEITPAEDVIHFFFQDRPEQRRGIPRLAPVINILQDIQEITNAKVQQVKTQSFISAVVTKNYAPAEAADLLRTSNSDGTRSDYQDLRGNAMYYLETGEDMKPFQSSTNAADFSDFLKSRLEAIGGAIGVPPEIWIEGFRDSNYSSARATISGFIRTVYQRRGHMVSRLLEPLHGFWVEKNPALWREVGAEYDTTEVSFTFPGVPAIDESKQNDADAKALAACLTTFGAVYAAKGKFWDTEFKQIAREKQRMAALGIAPNFAPANGGLPGSDGAPEQDPSVVMKAKADAYGVAVRAGMVTPQVEDEEKFREAAELAPMSGSVRSAWAENAVRYPITVKADIGAALPVNSAPVATEN